MLFYFFDGVRHKRHSPCLVNGVDELLLLRRQLVAGSLHLNCQKSAGLRYAADDVGNASRVGRDIATVRFSGYRRSGACSREYPST